MDPPPLQKSALDPPVLSGLELQGSTIVNEHRSTSDVARLCVSRYITSRRAVRCYFLHLARLL